MAYKVGNDVVFVEWLEEPDDHKRIRFWLINPTSDYCGSGDFAPWLEAVSAAQQLLINYYPYGRRHLWSLDTDIASFSYDYALNPDLDKEIFETFDPRIHPKSFEQFYDGQEKYLETLSTFDVVLFPVEARTEKLKAKLGELGLQIVFKHERECHWNSVYDPPAKLIETRDEFFDSYVYAEQFGDYAFQLYFKDKDKAMLCKLAF